MPPTRPLLAAGAMLTLAIACTQPRAGTDAAPVGTTSDPLGTLVREIGGEHVEVGPPRPGIEVLFTVGLGEEAPAPEEGVDVIAVGDLAVTGTDLLAFPGTDPSAVPPVPNPAVLWHPAGARAFSEVILGELAKRFPAHVDDFQAGAASIERRLEAIEEAARVSAATVRVPVLASMRPELAYAARAVGWEFEFFERPGIDLEEVDALAARVRAADVPVVFGPEDLDRGARRRLERRADVEYVDELRFDAVGRSGGLPRALLRMFTTFIDASGGDVRALTRLDLDALAATVEP